MGYNGHEFSTIDMLYSLKKNWTFKHPKKIRTSSAWQRKMGSYTKT